MDDNEAVNGYDIGTRIIPLEMEEEVDSLIHETGDFSGAVSRLTFRKRHNPETVSSASTLVTGFRGLLRTRTAFAVRNAILLGCLGWLVLLFVGNMMSTVNYLEENNMQDEDPRGPHQSSFGGLHNTGQPAGARAHEKHDEANLHHVEIPESNVGQGVLSFSDENVWNHNGHYLHDPYQCPFSSHLYNRTDEELQVEQEEFEAKMKQVKEKYGAWNLVDTYYDDHRQQLRPKPNFADATYGDLPITEFPVDAWQFDEEYVGKFIDQAKAMLHRMKEGIYEEYGHPSTKADGSSLSQEELKTRDALFQVIFDDFEVVQGQAVDTTSKKAKSGVAYLSRNAWDGLVRKLLNALVTNDKFYVVMAGDGAAAGHGNNFMQSSVMSFHYIMEPVFDFLGMTLISRNMAMSFAPTTFSALGGADIYGEADIMWYSGKLESEGQVDLFQKQAILSGERVPILLMPSPGNIEHDSNGKAWVGNLQPGSDMCEVTTSANRETLPPACQYVKCQESNGFSCEWYNSVCWVDRIDFAPEVAQDKEVPRDGNPGYRTHQLEGRKLSLLLLHALEEAFDKWEDGVEKDGFPLAAQYWHVGEKYEMIRENVRTYTPKEEDKVPACDALFSAFPIVCHVEMHAFTEWTPRITPDLSSLSKVLHPRLDTLNFDIEVLYEDIDVLPLQWKIPSDQVDVHAIAISTAAPPQITNDDLDDDGMSWIYEQDDVDPYGFGGGLEYEGENDNNDGGEGRSLRVASAHVNKLLMAADTSTRGTQRRGATLNATIEPGKGWIVYNEIAGFCDGSSQSTCNRSSKSTCLMAGHNDFQAGLLGDALSGWLTLRVQHVKEGIILIRLDTTVQAGIDTETEGWAEINDENGNNRRQLNIPEDFEFDYAINGNITTLSRQEFIDFGTEIVAGMTLYPLFLDKAMSEKERDDKDQGERIDVAIRIRSKEGRGATVLLSHVYYA